MSGGIVRQVMTARQQQVCDLLSEGLGNKEIAARLNIKEGSVKTRLQLLYRRFGIGREWVQRVRLVYVLHRLGY